MRPQRSPGSRAWIVAACLAVGILFRLAVAFPAHRYVPDADMTVNALCAFEVLRGETPVFAVGERLGSAGCHLTALLFLLFDVTRTALATGPFLLGCLLLPFWYLFLRELFGPEAAAFAAPFLAIPSPAFAFWSHLPNTYPETLLVCGTSLWLASRLARGDQRRFSSFGLGAAIGLGWWTSMLSLGCTAPAVAWLLWSRPRLLRERVFLTLTAGGFLLGAAPWLAYNLVYPLASFRGNFATRAAPGLEGVVDNARHLLVSSLPRLVAGEAQDDRLPVAAGWLASLTLLIVIGSAIFFFLVPRHEKPLRSAGQRASPWLLFVLVSGSMLVLNVASEAGVHHAVRYLLPLYLIVPGLLAVFLCRVASSSRMLAGGFAAVVLTFNVAGAHLPWMAQRQDLARWTAHDAELVAWLAGERIDAVLGGFWYVYPVSFLSQERIRGVPLEASRDLSQVADTLPASPQRWALLTRSSGELTPCLARSGLEGREIQVNETYRVFLPRDNPPAGESPGEFLRRIRSACYRPVRGADPWITDDPGPIPPPRATR